MSSILFNRDSSFFTVDFPDSVGTFAQKDALSISVTEEDGKQLQGSIVLKDQNQAYSRILRLGMRVLVTWGYKSKDTTLNTLVDQTSADVFTKPLTRLGVSGFILNPSGTADASGAYTTTCNFMATDWRGKYTIASYEQGTKKEIVQTVLARMGVVLQEVDFPRMGDVYSTGYAERQMETDFRFLSRLAREWHCVFRIGTDSMGIKHAVFLDPKKLEGSNVLKVISGGIGRPIFEWGVLASAPNVLSYHWESQEGENGVGDNVQYTMVGGVPVMNRYVATQDKVVAWKLNEQMVTDEIARIAATQGAAAVADRVIAINQTRDFESVKKYFTPIEQTTAPNGSGLKVTGKTLGDPTLTAGQLVTFGKGFPDILRRKEDTAVDFMLRKITHTLDMKGYFTDFEAVDFFTAKGLVY